MKQSAGNIAFNIVVWVLTLLSISMIAVYVYFSLTDKDLYNTDTSSYHTKVTDPATGQTMAPLTISYHENYNNSGKEVVEFRINCYSDYQKTALYTRGFQLVINENDDELWYYDGAFGLSFPSGHIYDETNDEGQLREYFYIDVGDDICAIRLDGKYKTHHKDLDSWKVVRTVGFLGINLLWEKNGSNFYHEYDVEHFYTYKQLLYKMRDIVKGCSYGTGDYTMPLVDLGDFLHMYKVENGHVADTAVGTGSIENTYFSIDVNYDRRGLSYADQSLFKSVQNDSNYNLTGLDFDVSYWKNAQIYNITEQDFDKRWSDVENGYYYTLKSDLMSELKTFNGLDINVVFDISKLTNVNVLGLDYFSLSGLELKSLTITSNVQKNITLQVGSIKGTTLTTIKTHNVTINNLSGLEVQYEMV